MSNKPFIINNTILVDPGKGLIKQMVTENETQVDAKLIHLLSVLMMHNHELVLRGLLARHVFGDLGKAGMTEVTKEVLLLRKALGDESDAMIETVAGKGYILHASVSFGLPEPKTQIEAAAGKEKFYWVAAVLLTAVIITGYYIYKVLRP